MEVGTVRVKVASTADPLYIVPISDVHAGARDADLDWLRRFALSAGRRDDTVVLWLGDHGEHITHKDGRWSAQNISPEIPTTELDNLCAAQTRLFLQCVEPLVKRTVAVLKGNHEYAVEKRGMFDPHAELCRAVNATWGSTTLTEKGTDPGPLDMQVGGMLRLSVERDREKHSFATYIHHGFFHGAKPNKVRWLEKLIHQYDADLVLVGHGHEPTTTGPVSRARPNQQWDKVVNRTALGVMCAAWKTGAGEGFATYEDKRGFFPRVHGPTVIRLWPAKRRFEVAFGEQAQCWIDS